MQNISRKERNKAEALPALDIDEADLNVRRRNGAIRKWLSGVKFRRCVFGGVSEADVWKKIGELYHLYEEAARAERVRYDTLLAIREEELFSFDEADSGRGE